MSSPPLTTREYAYLAVLGDGTHQEVTEILKIEPSLAWNAGEPSVLPGRLRKSMHWKRNSGLDDKEALQKHIEEIFLILEHKHQEMKELFFRGFDPYIQCVGYYTESSFGTHLNRDIVRRAGQLNLAIDFSLYQVSAHEHDG